MIKIRDLKKSFDGQVVLDGVSLDVERGGTAVVIGGSGSGKTVLLRHINGLIKPDEGEVIVDGVNVGELRETELNRFRRRIGMVFQGSALFDSMNVYQNVAFAVHEHTSLPESRVREIVKEKLALTNLEGIEEKMPDELSGGMKKRVAIARTIALEPEVILYDEPTAGLDPLTADAISNLIRKLQQKMQTTGVAVTHDMASAFKIADRIYMLKGGNFVAEGTPAEIRESTEPEVRQFITGEAFEEE
jgi:phospholipid/cholesterol/gamma-HCH transport system ATP-binding protein